jgi:peptide/nickel transport system permease protein
VAGYYRGITEMLLMRFADIQLALPFILIAIMFLAILGTGVDKVIFFMIVAQWVQYARLVRGSVLALREREFILSARAIASAMGASSSLTFFRTCSAPSSFS